MLVGAVQSLESLPTSCSCWQDARIKITESTSCLAVGGGGCLYANQPLEWDPHSWHFIGIAACRPSHQAVNNLSLETVFRHRRAVCTWMWTTDASLAKSFFEEPREPHSSVQTQNCSRATEELRKCFKVIQATIFFSFHRHNMKSCQYIVNNHEASQIKSVGSSSQQGQPVGKLCTALIVLICTLTCRIADTTIYNSDTFLC